MITVTKVATVDITYYFEKCLRSRKNTGPIHGKKNILAKIVFGHSKSFENIVLNLIHNNSIIFYYFF